MAAVTSGLLTIVKTGITIVSYFGKVTASPLALTIVTNSHSHKSHLMPFDG